MAWTLVTGGAKNLGADICQSLAQRGYSIIVHYNRSFKEAQQVAEKCQKWGVKAETIQGDFSSISSTNDFINRYLNQYGETEHLVNNVGNYLIKSALQTTDEEWTSLIQTNLHAPFALMRALYPSLIHHRGAIVNVGVYGIRSVHANHYSTIYTLTKSGLWMLTCSVARELASKGVRVNMVSPGHMSNSVDLPQDLKMIPMNQAATFQEISRVVAFFLDPQNSYITGQNMDVAGGLGI